MVRRSRDERGVSELRIEVAKNDGDREMQFRRDDKARSTFLSSQVSQLTFPFLNTFTLRPIVGTVSTGSPWARTDRSVVLPLKT